jgi:hypothetical protein
MIKKYIGCFCYSATGEGYRVYCTYFTTNNDKIDPKWIVWKKLSNHQKFKDLSLDFLKRAYKFDLPSIKIFNIEKNWIDEAMKACNGWIKRGQFQAIDKLAKKNTIQDGDFEFWFQYNRS